MLRFCSAIIRSVSAESCFQTAPRPAMASPIPQNQDWKAAVGKTRFVSHKHTNSIERMHSCLSHLGMIQSDRRSLNPATWPPPAKSTYGQWFPTRRPLNGGGHKRTRRSSAATDDQPEQASDDSFARPKLPVLDPDVSQYQARPAPDAPAFGGRRPPTHPRTRPCTYTRAHGAKQAELDRKAERVRALLGERLGAVPLHVEASPPLHYRMRAEFRVWHEVRARAPARAFSCPLARACIRWGCACQNVRRGSARARGNSAGVLAWFARDCVCARACVRA